MATMTATTARRNWSKFLQTMQNEPVHVTKHGQPAVVALSVVEYRRLLEAKAVREAAEQKTT